MKNRYSKKRYKLQAGIQKIEMDTPDYGKAYEIQAEQSAKNKGISQVAQQFSGSFAPVGQVGGMAADVIRNRSKNKKAGSVAGGAVEMGTSGAALGAQLGGPWGAAAGAVVGGVYGGIKGAKDYDKIKAAAKAEEEKTALVNMNKQYTPGATTDAQSALAKKGKYKVKTKQPRLIETEGREPIFSPKKPDGTRDLLYYNPNDPTHEEGGVKAVVMPKAQGGKQKLKAKPKYIQDKDSWGENAMELVDPSGTLSYDDAYRAIKNLYNNPSKEQVVETTLETLGALPLVGKTIKGFGKLGRSIKAGKFAGRAYGFGDAFFGEPLSNEGYNKVKDTYKGRNIAPQFFDKETAPAMGGVAFQSGAKQIKVNDLNNTAFSNNLANTPSANAANAFIQPQAGINQVARQIPQERRQETINTKRSHKKSVGPVKTVDPPMLYEMKPPPPRSTFNTKNDFKKGGKYVKTYQIGTQGTEADATYKHTKTFNSKPAYQAALQAHDDSLNLYSQSRYFTDLVKGSNLYNSTVENPEVKNITRSGLGRAQSPLKPYGAPNEYTEEIMSVAGMNPIRKDLYSRKESQYKSFKEWEEAKASGQPHGTHEGYEINMYKHPEMAVNFKADTAETIQPRKSKLKTSSDSTVNRTPVRTITAPTKETVADTTGTKTTPVAKKPVATRGKFVGREKTLLDKAGEFLNKVGSSKRMSNGKSVRVFK